MANTASAKKAARQQARRAGINKARRSRMRSSVRKVEEAIAAGDRTSALGRAEGSRTRAHARGAEGRDPHAIPRAAKSRASTHQIAKLA